MRHVHRLPSIMLAGILVMMGCMGSPVQAQNDVIVAPARHATLAFVFDVQALRNVHIISYRQGSAPETPKLFIWEPRQRQWAPIDMDEFAFGTYMRRQPEKLFLIGTDRDVPTTLLEAAGHARHVIRIDSLSLAQAANTLNQHLNFSTREWRRLGDRNSIELKETVDERHQWGRWGPPPSYREQETVTEQEEPVKDSVSEHPPEVFVKEREPQIRPQQQEPEDVLQLIDEMTDEEHLEIPSEKGEKGIKDVVAEKEKEPQAGSVPEFSPDPSIRESLDPVTIAPEQPSTLDVQEDEDTSGDVDDKGLSLDEWIK